MFTVPDVLAVTFVVVVFTVPILPLVEFNDTVPAVNTPLPLIAPEPFVVSVTVPAVAEPVDIPLLSVIAPLPAFVVRCTVPPGVVVPSVIAPPTVNVLPAVKFAVAVPTVDVTAPVFTVLVAVTPSV